MKLLSKELGLNVELPTVHFLCVGMICIRYVNLKCVHYNRNDHLLSIGGQHFRRPYKELFMVILCPVTFVDMHK